MKEEDLQNIRNNIKAGFLALEDAEKEIAMMERAGLTAEASVLRKQLNETRNKLTQLAAVYGK